MPQRRDIIVAFALFALVVIFFHHSLLGGEQFYAGDTYRYFYPLKKMAADAVRSGQAPVWNPLVHSGMPLHAALQAAVFYPFSALFYLLPFDFAYKWYSALHVFLAAAGMYALARAWKLRRVAAAFSAISYAFSGYVISFIDGLNIFSSIAWLPLVFFLFERAVQKPRISRVVLAAFAVAAQTLAGDPVSGYYTFLICALYWLILLASSAFQRRPRLETGARLLVLPAVAIFSLLLSYAQVGPSQEFTRYSTRAAEIGYDSAVWHSLAPMRLLTLAVPYLFGNPVENLYDWGSLFAPHFPLERTLYIGMMPLVLMPLALLTFREKRVYFLAGIFVLGLLLALGKHTPLYGLAHSLLPVFDKFRYPVKAFFLVSFSAAALAGYGVQFLVSREARLQQRLWGGAGEISRKFSMTLIIIGPVLLSAFLCDRYLFDLSSGILLRASSADSSMAQSFIPHMKSQLLRASLLFLIAAAIVWLRHSRRLSERLFRILAIGFISIDLLPSSYQLVNTAPESFYAPPRADSVLRADTDLFRLYRSPLDVEQHIGGLNLKDAAQYHLWSREMLSPNFGTLFGYAYTDGYESANLLWHNLLIRHIEAMPPLKRLRLLGLLNVKYIFSSRPLNHPDLRLKQALDENIFLYENTRCLKRAYFVPISIVASNEAVALRVLSSDRFNPLEAVVLVDKGGPGSLDPQPGIDQFSVAAPPNMKFEAMNVGDIEKASTPAASDAIAENGMNEIPITIDQYLPNRVELTVDTPTEGYVVLCDAYYPRWKAAVNGRKTDILRANAAVRAVAVPKGKSSITFVYDTSSFRTSSFISLAAAIFCTIFVLADVLRRRGKE